MAQSKPHLRSYADYACPFCYLEQQSLLQYYHSQEDTPKIEWRPYDIRHQKRKSDGSLDTDDGIGYPERVHESITRLKQEHSANEMLPVSEVPLVDSLTAQIVSRHVKRKYPDQWFAFNDAVFSALWREGRDISDISTVNSIASNIGLDTDGFESVTIDRRASDRMLELFANARDAGIDDVPTLVYDGRVLREVVSPDGLRDFIHG